VLADVRGKSTVFGIDDFTQYLRHGLCFLRAIWREFLHKNQIIKYYLLSISREEHRRTFRQDFELVIVCVTISNLHKLEKNGHPMGRTA
jgi:hypothetical protein